MNSKFQQFIAKSVKIGTKKLFIRPRQGTLIEAGRLSTVDLLIKLA
jgi:hypothetical protein